MKPDEIDYDNLTFSFTETKSMYVFDKKFGFPVKNWPRKHMENFIFCVGIRNSRLPGGFRPNTRGGL